MNRYYIIFSLIFVPFLIAIPIYAQEFPNTFDLGKDWYQNFNFDNKEIGTINDKEFYIFPSATHNSENNTRIISYNSPYYMDCEGNRYNEYNGICARLDVLIELEKIQIKQNDILIQQMIEK